MATTRTYGNMLNQKGVAKTPLKEAKPKGTWEKMAKKEKEKC